MNWREFLPAYRKMAKRNERLQADNDTLCFTINKYVLDIARYSIEAVELRTENERYAQSIVALNDELRRANEQATIPARPRARKKAASE